MTTSAQGGVLRPAILQGTITLMFTDIEGSTRLASRLGAGWPLVLLEHGRLLRAAAVEHDGREVDNPGDGFFFVFARANDAVAAAAQIQRELQATAWPSGTTVRVRIGVHTGAPYAVDGRYAGLDVHRAARISAAGEGGQVLVSGGTADLLDADKLPEGCALRELGRYRLKDIDEPERLYRLEVAGVYAPAVRLDAPTTNAVHASPATPAFPPAHGAALGVLGPVAAWYEGTPVELPALGVRRLLAVFALRPLDAISMDALVEALWQNEPPKTATQTVQVYISRLRKLLGDAIRTEPGGYRLTIPPVAIDLNRFEALWDEGRSALEEGSNRDAAEILRDALGLWRGAPIPELVYEGEFTHHAERLEEMRLACVEDRIDADLACGRHARIIGELESVTRSYPLRERPHGQLMLALYRQGRQADALEAFRQTRERLLNELGIEPAAGLVELNRRILRQDATLELTAAADQSQPASSPVVMRRSLLIASQASSDVSTLVSVLAPLLSGDSSRELILARLVEPRADEDTSHRLQELRRRLGETRDWLADEGVSARIAVFSSRQPHADLDRLARQEQAELVVLDGAPLLLGDRISFAGGILDAVAADVALVVGDRPVRLDRQLVVPFSGTSHDWAALELAAWAARSARMGVRLVGAANGAEDASRLLASASLMLQRMVGIDAEPQLVPRGVEGLLSEAAGAATVFTGLPDEWREKGLGEVRTALAQRCEVPVVFVRRGTRPSPFAPRSSATRFTWTLTRHL